ncbi:hypothetical protein L21SP5_03374 [Salinivirga cyanobacteriivorans]|uniref:Uncharacterized protein n=1 Tax=Salinivirga cyanobacteriivorans TaxID=1307839 RepID=A0A0S2I472_9BACT|nr:hypothetical protein [Salinivirga cyanobacteriivorans]ALO16987.1 hypothetical protein L21SP5_03374 [Salinivirga cyanobacteriivorans]
MCSRIKAAYLALCNVGEDYLVIYDELVDAPMVNARIESGMSSMHGREKKQMEEYLKQLKKD